MPNWPLRVLRIHSGRDPSIVICSQIHSQSLDFVEIPDPGAWRRIDLWRKTAYSSFWPKKSGYAAGSRRFGKGGQAGRPPRDGEWTNPIPRHACDAFARFGAGALSWLPEIGYLWVWELPSRYPL